MVKYTLEKEVDKMIKLVACDLDGTLLDGTHSIPKENAEAIKQLQEKGITFMSATGRTYDSVVSIFEPHGITCNHLLVNGAMIADEKGNVLFENPMKLENVRVVMEIMQGQDLCYNMYTKEGTCTPDIEKAKREFIEHMKQHGLEEAEIIDVMERNAFCKYEREIKDIDAYLSEKPVIYKMETFGGNVEVARKVKKQLSEHKELALSDSISENIEITEVSAQKGTTLMQYIKRIGIRPEEVVVIGDSMNDLSMMQLFPHSIAVGNATQAIKDAASYVTKTNDEYAVAYIIETICKA